MTDDLSNFVWSSPAGTSDDGESSIDVVKDAGADGDMGPRYCVAFQQAWDGSAREGAGSEAGSDIRGGHVAIV